MPQQLVQEPKERLLRLQAQVRGALQAYAKCQPPRRLLRANATESETAKQTASSLSLQNPVLDEFEAEVRLRRMEQLEDLERHVEAALGRFERHVFGLCTHCGAQISAVRLQRIPYAAACAACAAQYDL